MLSVDERVSLTSSCPDCNKIPKVRDAGKVSKRLFGPRIQTMHNGLKMVAGGYYGDWMQKIITNLKGHHEPQEELIFSELLQYCLPNSLFVELGCFWSYYSLWYLKAIHNSYSVGFEPDPKYLEIGKKNLKLNCFQKRGKIFQAAVVREYVENLAFHIESTHETINIPGYDFEKIWTVSTHCSSRPIEVLHVDIQGAEVNLLQSMLVSKNRPKFIVISTHHELISGSNKTHDDCLDLIEQLNGFTLIEHRVEESFSGDGLIVATFDINNKGINFSQISRCEPNRSLFGY